MDITNITKPARKLLPLKYCGAVIVAAGSASASSEEFATKAEVMALLSYLE